MTKADIPQVEEVPAEPVETAYNLTLSREEIDIIKNALAESKNFKAFVNARRGEVENKLLVELENF